MRTRTQKNLFDNIFWYTIYSLPLIITFFTVLVNGMIHTQDSSYTFDFINILNSNLSYFNVESSVVYTTLVDIFGSSSTILPLFNNNTLFMYLAYFVNCIIIHLMVDIIAVVPRLGHKLIDKVIK